MVSKNNQQWKQQQEAQRVPHYGLRKLSVGVASVLLSTTLYMGVTAHADTTVETSSQPTVGQPASTAAGTSTGDVTTDVQSTADQPASTATNSNAPENDVSAKSAPTVLPKQPANATDAQPTATTSGVQPVMNLAVESDNNDLVPKHETVDSQWTIHYVNQADHQQELKAPTVINMQYTRTNTPQSDGTIQYGDWSYVSGSFKQTGTPITVNDSDNPTKEDNVDENGENMDVFTIVAMYPTIAGHTMHNGINGTRLSDNLRNDDRQAAMMSKDTYAEYDVAKERFVAVKFVDDQLFKQQVGQAITLTGRDGDTVNLNLTVPDSDKYRLADGQQLPTTYTFTAGSGDLTIHLAHKAVQREATIDVKLALITEVNIDSIDHTSAVISQTQWGQLDDGLKHGKPEFISPAGVFPLVEAGTLTGHVNYDLVDNEFVSFGNDWTNLNLGGHTYQLPNGDDVVNGVLVGPKDSWGEPLKKYYLKYHPNVDPDYATYPWHGYLSVNVTSDPNGPLAGWNSLGLQGGLAGNKSNILAKANGDRAATAVEMANKTIDVSFLPSPNAFREQDGQLQRTLLVPVVGVYVPYVEKTVTRTINVTTPDGKMTMVKQTATLAKQVNFNKDAHPAWTTGEWASYDVPTIPGYTASQTNVAQQAVTGTMEDQTVNITYTANSQTTTVVYQTEDGTPVHTTTVNGQTGQTVTVPNEVPTGWQVVDGKVPSEITFGPDGAPKTVVTIAHSHVTVTPDAPKTTSDKLPDNPDKAYPAGVGETDLNKTVTRTIKVTTPDGQTKTVTQTAKLTRTADVDEVTGDVSYGNWSTDEWAKYDVPTIDDYEPSRTTVEAAKVDANTPDQSVTITYKQITHPSVETATKTLTEHFIYGEGDRQGKVAAPDSQIKLFFKRTNQVTADGTVVSYGQWELDPSQGTNGYQILSGQWQIPTPGNYDVLRAVAELPNGKKLSVDENREYHYSSSLAWLNPELSAVDYFADPDFYDVRTEHTTYVQAVHVDLVLRDQDPMNVGNPYVGRIHLTGFADDSRNLTWDDIVAAGKHDKMDLANYELVPGQTVTVDFEPQSPDSILVNLQHKHHQVQTVDHVKVILAPALIDNLHGYTAEMWLTLNSQIDQDGRPKKDSYHQVTVAVPVTLTVDAVTQWILNAKVTPTTVNIQESQYADSDLNGHDYGIASTDDSGEFPFGPDWRQVLAKLSNGHREQLAKLLGVSNDQTLDEAISNSTVETAHFSYPKRNMNGNVQQAVTKNQIVIDGDVVSFPAFSDNGPIDHAARLYDENNPLTDEVMSFQILNWHFPKPVTRTINMHLPSGKVETTTQVVDAGKTVAFNDEGSLTLESTHGSLEWANYEVPTQAGYTPSQAVVAAQLIDDQTTDQTVDIYYTPNQHQINVEYVDDDDHGKVVKTDQVSGKTDQTITVTPSAPASYDLVDDNNRTYTVTSADGQTVQIHVKHHQVTTTEDKTVTRAINVHTPHDGVEAIKQTAELTRDVTTDQVTGEKTYDDWTTGQWESYTPEVVPGYTPSTNEVPNTNVDGSTGDQMVDVTYIADTQKVEIVYLDDTKDGAVVKTDQATGKTDETVKVTPDVPAGYELVGKVPGDYTMTADGHQTITVHLVHQTKTTSESKTITRTINVHTPHDGTKVVKQTATLTRAVTTDQVTGEKTYGDWSTTKWDHYAVPAVAGYVPSIEQITQQVVNGTTTDQTIDVTYSSGEHTTHINYVDGDGNTIHTTTIKGQTDGTAQVPNETPAGWTAVGEPVPNELTFGPDGHADVTVTVDHQHVTVTPDQPKAPTDKLPDNPAKTYPNGVGHDNLNKTITRTIKLMTPDGQTKTVEQTAHLTRTADVDEVTGEVTYGKWTTGEWANYEVPTVPGYTPSQSEVPTTEVTDDTKDQTVTVTYTAVDHTTTISYVDPNGKVVHTTVVTGQTDQTVKVPNEVPTGWTVTGQPTPDTVTFGPDGHNNVTVTVDHQHVTVTPDKPQSDGTKLPDNPNQTFHGVAETDLNKLVTRTIEVTTPSGKTNTVKQTAKLTRTADVDEVTGEVTYGKWTTGTWSSYTVPNVAGYTPSQAVVTEVKVDADTTNQTVKITYTADSHTTHINYVTKAGKVVHTTTVTGATDQTVKVPNETPAGWTITTGEVPSEVTFGANGHGDVTVTIAHQTVTVTPDQPQTDGTKLPDNPTLTFRGVSEGDLNRTVTRTITLNVPGQAPQVITQTVRLTRTATVDEVTGEVTYGDWTTGRWDTYAVPTVDGYTADQTTIPAVEVTSATTSQEMVINYTVVPTTPSDHQPAAKQATTATPNTPLQTPVTKAQAQKLPQTGETQNVLAPIGLALLGILSGFSLFAKKRKAGKDDKHQS